MRKFLKAAAVLSAALLVGLQAADAGLLGMPMNLRGAIQRIKFEEPTMAPMAYTMFCLHYKGECTPHVRFRGGPVHLTADRWADLVDVNKSVNKAIIPQRETRAETWLINPDHGDCNDYAVTKRHELIKRGWPARVLLLSEVVVPNGEHHLVVVVRTNSGDLVLDNLTPQIRPWSRAPYQWVRIQLPNNARLWASLKDRDAA